MTLRQHIQEENNIASDIQRILFSINEIKKLKNYEIAEKIGVTPETISRGISGKYGSTQLLKALELLLENIQMRERLDQIEAAQRTMALLTAPTGPHVFNDHLPDRPKPESGGTPRVVYGKDTKGVRPGDSPKVGFKSGVSSEKRAQNRQKMREILNPKKDISDPTAAE